MTITKILFKSIGLISVILFPLIILIFSIRGYYGNPDSKELNSTTWKDDGPFELSPERGRFALTYSIIEEGSVFFSVDTARFVIPDLGFQNGKYVSLFAPAVSYLAIPGYVIGKFFGASQVGAFAVISLFALLNSILIRAISRRLGANNIAATIGSLVFLFATPAFSYATVLYQHHISTFLILMAIYTLLVSNSIWSLFLVWFLCATSIPVDYPNLFLMFPIGIYAISKLLKTKSTNRQFIVTVHTIKLFSFVAMVFPLLFFLWFNQKSYGNPLQFSGTVSSVHDIDENGNPTGSTNINLQDVSSFVNSNTNTQTPKKSVINFFKSRNIVNGLYIHLFSPDRGIIVFAPIVLFGLLGLYKHTRSKYHFFLPVLIGVLAADFTLYTMWGDPWGGWAFGSRYLIPAYAVLSILISFTITRFRRKWYFVIPFWLVLIYSIFVNSLGVLTTSAMPPQVEADALGKQSGRIEKYSWDRNWEIINSGKSKSFVFQTWAHNYVSSVHYFYFISGSVIFISSVLLTFLIFQKNKVIYTRKLQASLLNTENDTNSAHQSKK